MATTVMALTSARRLRALVNAYDQTAHDLWTALVTAELDGSVSKATVVRIGKELLTRTRKRVVVVIGKGPKAPAKKPAKQYRRRAISRGWS